MSFDLTNKNISDTFQNLLQKTGSDGRLYDLLGNQVRDLTIDGTLTANSYVTSESIVNTSSGSTTFGNSADDVHTFTGSLAGDAYSLLISGTLSASTALWVGNQTNYISASEGGLTVKGTGTANLFVAGNISGSEKLELRHNQDKETGLKLQNEMQAFSFGLPESDTVAGFYIISGANKGLTGQDTENPPLFIEENKRNFMGLGTHRPTKKLTVEGDISASGGVYVNAPRYEIGKQSINYGTGADITGSLEDKSGKAYGDIVSIGTSTTEAGKVYCLDSDFSWTLIDADGGCVSSSLLGVAVSASSANGMLLRGFAQVSQSKQQIVGQKVYASKTPGLISGSTPDGTGDVVRVLGYALNAGASNQSASIYFNPDNTWIELS